MLRTVTRHPLLASLTVVIASLAIAGVTAAAIVSGPAASSASSAQATRARAALERYLRDGVNAPALHVPGTVRQNSSGLVQTGSYNWSGYVDDNSTGNTYSAAAGSWKQPKITCPTDENRLAVWWVGLDGWNTSTVEQDGTAGWCYQGTAFYYTWWEMYPTNNIQYVGSSVAAGDSMAASVVFAGGNYTLQVTDSTHPANSLSEVEQCQVTCTNGSAEWIAESPHGTRGQWPLPKFAPWKVSGATVTSGTKKGKISTFPDEQVTMLGGDGTTKLGTAGALNTAGNGFTSLWDYAFD